MTKRRRSPADHQRKTLFRETARSILRTDRVKRGFGEAVDTAGAIARAMEQAYRLGLEDSLAEPGAAERARPPATTLVQDGTCDAMTWGLIPPRTRNTFWSICLAALGREGRTTTSSHLIPVVTPRGTAGWQLVVPDRQTYEKSVGEGTIVTLVRLGLLQPAATGNARVVLTDFGINTWNRFCERGGRWPDDLVDRLP